jgi:hypothetical protein
LILFVMKSVINYGEGAFATRLCLIERGRMGRWEKLRYAFVEDDGACIAKLQDVAHLCSVT